MGLSHRSKKKSFAYLSSAKIFLPSSDTFNFFVKMEVSNIRWLQSQSYAYFKKHHLSQMYVCCVIRQRLHSLHVTFLVFSRNNSPHLKKGNFYLGYVFIAATPTLRSNMKCHWHFLNCCLPLNSFFRFPQDFSIMNITLLSLHHHQMTKYAHQQKNPRAIGFPKQHIV